MWGSDSEVPKYHLLNWQTVCSPIHCGGLGIRSLSVFNKALLGKWLWRFASETDRLWRILIAEKYGTSVGD